MRVRGFLQRLFRRAMLALLLCASLASSAESPPRSRTEIVARRDESAMNTTPSPAVESASMSRPAQVKLTGMVTIPRKCVTLEIQMEGKTALPYLAEGESHGPVR